MSRASKNVILVEQNDLIRLLAAEWLSAAGFDVVAAAGAGDVPAGGSAGVVIADLPAPRETGAQILRLLRQSHPGVPLIATSACFLAGVGGCADAAKRLGVAR